MKTINPEKLFAGINYGFSFIYNNFIASIITFVFIVSLLKNYNEYKHSLKNRALLLSLIAFLLFLSVVIGGGDWMPSSRYLVVPGIILLIISVYSISNFFEIKNIRTFYFLNYLAFIDFLFTYTSYFSKALHELYVSLRIYKTT